MTSKTCKVKLVRDGSMCFIPVTFDPVAVFGKTRAPVSVTLNGHTYRSTVFLMDGKLGIPLRKSHREAAGLEGNETLQVTFTLDEKKREVEAPPDLLKALKRVAGAMAGWNALSFTYQREHVEGILGAKKEETRSRRVEKAVEAAAAKAKKIT